ncbi:MAG: hypothetical protein JOY90_04290 [Bradyrhizobium sp.]|uniref:NAD(P)-binding domain-containing protein n=1 Tax=Bradyrhizobium sp. TaxID=376 RepID=UPI001D2EF3F4|nr:NAD(P)-binding domain-containing protein [Bradyrhizobium sp.]MBV9559669.1 hypothetical protein [Bradyrhizobium sp.]
MLDTRDLSAEKTRSCSKESGVTAGTFSETARFGELLVLSVLGRVVDQVVKLAGAENFEGKTVIDTTSPLSEDPPVNGVLQYTIGPNESLGERNQALMPKLKS